MCDGYEKVLFKKCAASTTEGEASLHPALKVQAVHTSDSDGQAPIAHEDKKSTKAEKKKVYKYRLSYRKEWEQAYPWVYCTDPAKGMFCHLCQKHGNPPVKIKRGWTSRGICDWNHDTELLRVLAHSNARALLN